VWRREGVGGDLIHMYKYLMGGKEEEGTRLFSQKCPLTGGDSVDIN